MERSAGVARGDIIRVMISLLLAGVSALGYFFALRDPAWVRESFTPFSRKTCSILSRSVAALPFSVAEFLLYIFLILALSYVIYTVSRLISHPARFLRLFRFFSRMALCAATLLFFFTFIWGLNYAAPPLESTLGLKTAPSTKQQLVDTAYYMLRQANDYAGLTVRGENGVATLGTFNELSRRAGLGYVAASGKYAFYDCGYSCLAAPKPVTAWKLMSYAGIAGIFVPFTAEANVNPGTPQACLPFTMAHELAHRIGVAPEDEANFSAFLCCVESRDAAFIYSGYFQAFLYCYNAVAEIDAEQQRALWNGMNESVKADLYDLIKYNKTYEGPVSKAGSEINDVYLKTMMQEDGVRSYGTVTDLLIAWYAAVRS